MHDFFPIANGHEDGCPVAFPCPVCGCPVSRVSGFLFQLGVDVLHGSHSSRPEPVQSPSNGLSQLLVPQTVDDRVQERSQSREQHGHDDTLLKQHE